MPRQLMTPRLRPAPSGRVTLRHHLYLRDLALHLCPFHLPGSFVVGVGLLQLASPRLLLLKLHPEVIQQCSQGLQHLPVFPKLHTQNSTTGRNSQTLCLASCLLFLCVDISHSQIALSLSQKILCLVDNIVVNLLQRVSMST